MIDPFNITKYDRTIAELEELVFFCVMVPGHKAKTTAVALNKFLEPAFIAGQSPFEYIRSITGGPYDWRIHENIKFWDLSAWGRVVLKLEQNSIGCSSRIGRCLWELAYSNINLQTCWVEQLEAIHGIGKKTSRFILLHSRKGLENIAILDIHILRYLAELGYKVPKTTPTSDKEYRRLEEAFLIEAKKSGKTVAEFDLEVWRAGASK